MTSSMSKLQIHFCCVWSSFHSFRVSELRCLWKDLFASLGVDAKFAQDPLLGEYVNDKLFGEHSVNSPSSNDIHDYKLNALIIMVIINCQHQLHL